MKVAVPKEVAAGERRVALVPESAGKLTKAGLEVVVEAGAGSEAGFADAAYIGAGVGSGWATTGGGTWRCCAGDWCRTGHPTFRSGPG